MDHQTELEVARRLREGKPDAWRALYETFARRIWVSVACRIGADSTDVADVVQETFLAAARSAPSYDPSQGSLWAWLSGIARHHVALYYRQKQRQDRVQHAEQLTSGRSDLLRWLESDQEVPDVALVNAETARLVRATLSVLSDDHETLLIEKYFDGATVGEMAGRRGATETAIRSKLARARGAFRKAFLKTSELDS